MKEHFSRGHPKEKEAVHQIIIDLLSNEVFTKTPAREGHAAFPKSPNQMKRPAWCLNSHPVTAKSSAHPTEALKPATVNIVAVPPRPPARPYAAQKPMLPLSREHNSPTHHPVTKKLLPLMTAYHWKRPP